MPSAAAEESSESLHVFCTPVSRPQAAAPPTGPPAAAATTSTRPLAVLLELKNVNESLHHLSEQMIKWTEAGQTPAATATGSCDAARRATDTPGAADCAAAAAREKVEREALCLVLEATETTRQIALRCEAALRTYVSRLHPVEQSPSGPASGQVSCGISGAESASDPARYSTDGRVNPSGTEIPVVQLARDTSGPVPRLLLDPPPAPLPQFHGVARPVSTPVRLRGAAPALPTRRLWPAAYFCYLAHVEFKRRRVRRFQSPVSVAAGTYVIVPGDRGYDCGLVVQCAAWNPHRQAYEPDTIQTLDPTVLSPGGHGVVMEIIRVATDEEVHRLHREHVSMERLALTTCCDLVDRLHLPMDVTDCEYQFDGTKISFFFDAAVVIDFRQLNRELFRVFNARIWMQNTNTTVRNTAPPSGAARQTWQDHQGRPLAPLRREA
ncbi:PSP1 C-terminal conserved region containing protein [Novymonas esmeraldas]|uniref:PSP1 C-terminal conserved region containing protein n=1 Tax=Novymonas esmeraldas TaxID=1808958 RepID=A0AAW0F053_9TRYP